jgi:hypothetical protein
VVVLVQAIYNTDDSSSMDSPINGDKADDFNTAIVVRKYSKIMLL